MFSYYGPCSRTPVKQSIRSITGINRHDRQFCTQSNHQNRCVSSNAHRCWKSSWESLRMGIVRSSSQSPSDRCLILLSSFHKCHKIASLPGILTCNQSWKINKYTSLHTKLEHILWGVAQWYMLHLKSNTQRLCLLGLCMCFQLIWFRSKSDYIAVRWWWENSYRCIDPPLRQGICGDCCKLIVFNSGSGLAKSAHARIFDILLFRKG